MKRWCALVAVLFAVMASASAQEKPAVPDRWEPAIQKFEAEDKANPPVRDGIVFIGASSIVRWNLAESFPDLRAVNRGFGGSEMADSARYAARDPRRRDRTQAHAGALASHRPDARDQRADPRVLRIAHALRLRGCVARDAGRRRQTEA